MGFYVQRLGFFAMQGMGRIQWLGQLEYSVDGTWQLEVLGGGAYTDSSRSRMFSISSRKNKKGMWDRVE